MFTPGGDPTAPQVTANTGDWFRRYAAQQGFENPGWLETITAKSTTMTLSYLGKEPAGFVFVPGQIDKNIGAGPAKTDMTTTVLKVMNTVLILHDPAKTQVMRTTVLYDTLIGAVRI
jgi:hypothetical protein